MVCDMSTDTDALTFTIEEFCRAVGLSPRTFHRMRGRGDGPPVTKIGNRTLIRRKAAKQWLVHRERITQDTDPHELHLDVVCDCLVSILCASDAPPKVGEWASIALEELDNARGITTKPRPSTTPPSVPM
jgi:hypothetical protein